jgi:hypothetical protein
MGIILHLYKDEVDGNMIEVKEKLGVKDAR